jgi:hypothetical protein
VIFGDTWSYNITPQFSIAGNTISWFFPHASLRPDTVFVYGVI